MQPHRTSERTATESRTMKAKAEHAPGSGRSGVGFVEGGKEGGRHRRAAPRCVRIRRAPNRWGERAAASGGRRGRCWGEACKNGEAEAEAEEGRGQRIRNGKEAKGYWGAQPDPEGERRRGAEDVRAHVAERENESGTRSPSDSRRRSAAVPLPGMCCLGSRDGAWGCVAWKKEITPSVHL
jgi:hypothetical protein